MSNNFDTPFLIDGSGTGNGLGFGRLSGTAVAYGPQIFHTTVDPSAGAGVVAPIASLALYNDGLGQSGVWIKTGAGDTAWTEKTVP